MDADQFFDLADLYAAYGWNGQDSIKRYVDGDTEGMPKRNQESALKFLGMLHAAGVDTYGLGEENNA